MDQDILFYARDHPEGFKFVELGNSLLEKNNEYRDEFSMTPASHTPRSTRLGIKRHRIERHLDTFIHAGLLRINSIVKSEKNESYNPSIYQLTLPGHLLSWLLETMIERTEDTRSKRYEIERNILRVIKKYLQVNDSYVIEFVYRFFLKCFNNRFFGVLVNYFLTKIVSIIKIYDGQQLLRSFLGLDRCINWIFADFNTFLETINELGDQSRKMVLFQLKTEIEKYYGEHYLTYEWQMLRLVKEISSNFAQNNNTPSDPNKIFAYRNSPYDDRILIRNPGKKWQEMRFKYCSEFSKLVLPRICQNCHREAPFAIDIFEYFNRIISAIGPYPNDGVAGDCLNCGESFSTGCKIIQLPFYTSEGDILCPSQ